MRKFYLIENELGEFGIADNNQKTVRFYMSDSDGDEIHGYWGTRAQAEAGLKYLRESQDREEKRSRWKAVPESGSSVKV